MVSLLERQIRRHLGDPATLPAAWRDFLGAVNQAYEQADSDRRMIEHSLELMSQELTERNRDLLRELGEKQQTETALQFEKSEQAFLIDKLEEAHNQLLQSEKMASIGQLAAGVAHEINNPIGYVNSNLGTLRGYVEQLLAMLRAHEEAEPLLPADAEAVRRLRALKAGADLDYIKGDVLSLLAESSAGVTRVRSIVQDLKDFSHVDEGEWQWADLRRGLDSTLNVVSNEIKYKADVVKEYGAIPHIECLAPQLNQVFLNLLVNAAHAMVEGQRGTITLKTGADEHLLWVEVADNGCGIAPENLKRIFDPFFTTKPVGKGTGLGLSLSYGIVQKHGGRIEVNSQPGKGTSFRVILPLHQSHGSEAGTNAAASP